MTESLHWITNPGYRYEYYRFRELRNGNLAVRPLFDGGTADWGITIVIGTAIIFLLMELSPSGARAYLVVLLTLVIILGGILISRARSNYRFLVDPTSSECRLFSTGLRRKILATIPFKDIAAFQVVRLGLWVILPDRYEMNLILKNGNRMHVHSDHRQHTMQSDAARIAEAIGVPVWEYLERQ